LKLLVVVETERKALAAANEQLQAITTELQATNAELAPKAEAADILLGAKQAVTFQEAAQVIGIPNMGRNNLFKALVELKLIINTQHPYQRYIEQGIFVVRENNTPFGVTQQILITQKGLQYIIPLLKEHGMKSSKINDRVTDSFRLTPKAI
jgi:phage antirepressor YoqD-like protein